MTRAKIITITVAAVTALSVVMGLRERFDGGQPSPVTRLWLTESLPPAVVVAKRPTLSEILDLVLRERPTASELAGFRGAHGDFPEGSDEAYVAGMLSRRSKNRALVNSIAAAVVKVMPFHAGKWDCGSRDLFDVESNICHGVAVLADNLYRSRTLRQALLGYNGCVRGTNTPDCWKYPKAVYRRADFMKGGTE
jgi:hypothetical protein